MCAQNHIIIVVLKIIVKPCSFRDGLDFEKGILFSSYLSRVVSRIKQLIVLLAVPRVCCALQRRYYYYVCAHKRTDKISNMARIINYYRALCDVVLVKIAN